MKSRSPSKGASKSPEKKPVEFPSSPRAKDKTKKRYLGKLKTLMYENRKLNEDNLKLKLSSKSLLMEAVVRNFHLLLTCVMCVVRVPK